MKKNIKTIIFTILTITFLFLIPKWYNLLFCIDRPCMGVAVICDYPSIYSCCNQCISSEFLLFQLLATLLGSLIVSSLLMGFPIEKWKNKKFRFTISFAILGFLISSASLFPLPFKIYAVVVLATTVFFCSIGWMVDMFRLGKPLFPILLILFYLIGGIILGYVLYEESRKIHVEPPMAIDISEELAYNPETRECIKLTFPSKGSYLPEGFIKYDPEEHICDCNISHPYFISNKECK